MSDDTAAGPEEMPADLVPIREAAHMLGITEGGLYSRITRGLLNVYGPVGQRTVSLAAVRALIRPPEPGMPPSGVSLSEASATTGISIATLYGWLRQGFLTSWRGKRGHLVLVEDVRRVAEKRSKAGRGVQEQELRGVRGEG